MEDITKDKDLLGEEIALMHKGGTVYVIYPNQVDDEGNSKAVMIPKSLFIEFGMKFM